MRPQTIIARKRDGNILSRDEINAFISGVTDGSWADYQISALIMAMFLNELNPDEQAYITEAMLNSGEVLDFSDIKKPKSDKHSTGGVGDKTSLIIAPLVAACGVAVPMISGRGLGHTGGTLDKLESIPGFNTRLTTGEIKDIIGKCGYAMAGQTDKIAPADRKIYSLRDATATVPTIPLIVASIMSKKLAEGLDSLVLDVKTGNGAFIEDPAASRRLARAMVETGGACGVTTKALITDMSQPLGGFVGNALEVYECVRIMRSEPFEGSKPLLDLSLELAARMVEMSGISANPEKAFDLLRGKIHDGSALECFRHNVRLQGGDESICDDPSKLFDGGLVIRDVVSERSGFVQSVDTKAVGFAVLELGGGREKAEDGIDHGVGFCAKTSIGSRIEAGDPICTLYCRSDGQFEHASRRLKSAYSIGESSVEARPLVLEIVD
ncbi:MAG: thymidine phosphorylase [Acidobacteriota bacterium]|nr:thymidine phosphorylase [Acidobacteriota bacterium]MDH3529079.1 thymidine phosphorylase [Acidobacteriota bacterium]